MTIAQLTGDCGCIPEPSRKHERHATLTVARLLSGGEWHECQMLDISVGGARLQLDHPVPDDPDVCLEIGHFGQFQCNVAWQGGRTLGIRFKHAPADMADVIMGLATYG